MTAGETEQKGASFLSVQFDPAEMAARGRVGGLTTIVRHGPEAIAERARTGLQARFELEVDPDGTLPPSERARRAEFARRLHMARLSLLSARSRSATKRSGTKTATGMGDPVAVETETEVASCDRNNQLSPA